METSSAKYRMNHLGFMPNAKKRIYSYAPSSMTFTVEWIHDVKFIPVYTGHFEKISGEDGEIYAGDFSSVTREGDYRIIIGEDRTRYFRIQRNLYETVIRMMLGYFRWQRCGSPLGWAGKCHLDDGYIAETGEHVDLSGGYHQSCDLRKSPCGVSLGVLNMIRAYKLSKDCQWAEFEWLDEIEWAADYYVKTVQPSGRIYNTLNAPLGWEGKIFYQTEPPASASWTAIRLLAEASSVIESKKEKYLESAERAYSYMTSEHRYMGKYKHPDITPIGMDQEYFFADIYKDSTEDISYCICASVALYKATSNDKYYNIAAEKCAALLERFIDSDSDIASALLRVDKDNNSTISSSSYVQISAGYEGFFEMMSCSRSSELTERISFALNKISDHYKTLCGRSIFGMYPRIYSNDYLDKPTGFADENGNHPMTVRDTITTPLYNLDDHISYTFGEFTSNLHLQDAVNNLKLADLTEHTENTDIAQNLIDYFLGCNKRDITFVTGVGFNQVNPPVFGQFFPSTPPIPGAVSIGGMGDTIEGSYHSEYDMPAVGLAMYALALAKHRANTIRCI